MIPRGANSENESHGKLIASGLTPAAEIASDDEVDLKLLQKMSGRATQYISSFSWCEGVLESYFAGGLGGIFAVFFFHIRPSRPEVDPWIWIMVGDIPSAYLPLSDCRSPSEALDTYIEGMSKWIELARQGKTGTAEQGVPPVNVPATPEWAERLRQKLDGLKEIVRPFFENGDDTSSIR